MHVLSELARKLLDGHAFFVLTTLNPNGWPQSSVMWARRDGDEIVFSTIRGRRKELNMARDPKVTMIAYDPMNPYRYVEIRGTVTMTEEGGDELINELSLAYEGKPFVEARPATRVVCRLTPHKVITH